MSVDPSETRFHELFRELAVAGRAMSSYPQGHPAISASLARAHATLAAILGEAGALDLVATRDALLWKERRLASPPAAQLAALLRRRRAARLLVEPGVTEAELEVFLRALSIGPQQARQAGSLAAELGAAGLARLAVSDLDLSGLALVEGEGDGPASAAEAGALAERVVRRLVAGGLLSGEMLARWTGAGRTADDLVGLLVEGGSAGRAAGAFAAVLRAAAEDFCDAPDPARAAAVAAVHARLQPGDRARLVDELAVTMTRRAVARESLGILATALPATAMAQLGEAAVRAGAAGPEEPAPGPAPAQIAPGQVAALRRVFVEGDVDSFRDSDTPVEQLVELLELPDDGPAPELPAGAAAVAAELAGGDAPAALASRMLRPCAEEDLAADVVTRLLARVEGGWRRALAAGQVTEALALADRILTLADGPPPRSEPFRAARVRMSDRAAMDALAAGMPLATAAAAADVPALLAKLRPEAVPHLLDVLAGTEEKEIRLRLLEVLPALGPVIARHAEARLADPRWYVVRNMLLLLRRVGDARSLPSVRRCVDHPDLRVRLEAIHNLLAFDRRVPRELLRRALHDPDPRQAAAAMDLAGQYGYAEAVEPIVEYLRAWDPLGKRREVRLKAIRALAAIRDPAGLAGLSRFRARLAFPRPALEERREVFRSLAAYPSEWRRPWIEAGLRSRDPEIRRICASLAAPAEGAP